MNLLEYIKMSYKRPNKAVLKGLGASEELIEYLTETPLNTNFAIVHKLIEMDQEDGGDETSDLVIFDGTITFKEYQNEGVGIGVYGANITTSFTYEDFTKVPESILIEIDGQTIELPHTPTNFGVAYGDMDGDWAGFDTYPIWIWLEEDGLGDAEIDSNVYNGEQKVIIKFPQKSDSSK